MSNTSVEEAKCDVLEKGFHKFEDPEIGSKIETMRASGLSFNFYDEAGLNFWRNHILLNAVSFSLTSRSSANQRQRIQDIISALSPDARSRYFLVHQGVLAPDPGHIQTARRGGQYEDFLIIQAWPKKSKVTFYSRSHTADLTRLPAPNSFWETSKAQLKENGCEAESCSFEQGGLCVFTFLIHTPPLTISRVISDARVSFERQEERSYFYVYAKSFILEQLLKQEQALGRKLWGVRPPASCDVHELAKLGVHIME
jgi:hypothetical protein